MSFGDVVDTGETKVLIPGKQIKNFYKSVAEHKDVAKLAMMLSSSVNSFRTEIDNSLQKYSHYYFLWEEDREQVLNVRKHVPKTT